MISKVLIFISLSYAFDNSGNGSTFYFHARDVPTIHPRRPYSLTNLITTPVEQTIVTPITPTMPKPPYNFPYADASLISNNSSLIKNRIGNTNKTSLSSDPIEITQDNVTKSPVPILNITVTSSRATDTEVKELLNIPIGETDLKPVKPSIVYTNDKNNHIDDNVELIDDGKYTEDMRVQQTSVQEEGVALIQGQLAAILAGVFVAVAVIGYIGLISWRKHLESRYSDRQMLVNEMEFNEREAPL